MTVTANLGGVTPRFDLPLLYTAQAQKEVAVNEAFALADALLHCAIEGVATTAPSAPTDGSNWLLGAGASGDWAGQDGKIACRQNGNWVFVAPRDGLTVLNRANGQFQHYCNGWQAPATPTLPSGGSTVDDAARTAIAAIVGALRTAGIISGS